jgi:uncharacterized protein (TIGR00255 family)
MKSMTGFGSASLSRAGVLVSAEARSFNNRYLKVSIRSSSVLSSRETEIENLVRERIARGTVSLSVRIVMDSRPLRVRMNTSAVREYRKLFRKLRKEGEVEGEPTLELLAALPGVFEVEETHATLDEERYQLVEKAVVQAVDRLVRMRKREGTNLKRDFSRRRTRISGLVRRIRTRAPRVAEENLGRLEERVNRLTESRGIEVEEGDLVRELGILAERSDVTEELTRLESHLDQFGSALSEDGAQGRRLEFLVQEMLREANTIGAKSADVEVSRLCVDLKVELDRLKEQVLNVE